MPTKLTNDQTAIDQLSPAAGPTDSARCAPAELALRSIHALALVLARQAAREDDAEERQATEGIETSGTSSQEPPRQFRRQET